MTGVGVSVGVAVAVGADVGLAVLVVVAVGVGFVVGVFVVASVAVGVTAATFRCCQSLVTPRATRAAMTSRAIPRGTAGSPGKFGRGILRFLLLTLEPFHEP